jgi:hypothetical protein
MPGDDSLPADAKPAAGDAKGAEAKPSQTPPAASASAQPAKHPPVKKSGAAPAKKDAKKKGSAAACGPGTCG